MSNDVMILCGGCEVLVNDPKGQYFATVKLSGDQGGETVQVEPGGYVNRNVRAVPRAWLRSMPSRWTASNVTTCWACGSNHGARMATGMPVDHPCPHGAPCEGGAVEDPCPACVAQRRRGAVVLVADKGVEHLAELIITQLGLGREHAAIVASTLAALEPLPGHEVALNAALQALQPLASDRMLVDEFCQRLGVERADVLAALDDALVHPHDVEPPRTKDAAPDFDDEGDRPW